MKPARVLAFGCAALVVAAAACAGQAAGPMAQLRQSTDKILAVLRDPALEGDAHKAKRRKQIAAIVDERFHWEEMAQRSLARHWRSRSPDERKEFVALFTDLVRNTYMSKVEGYSGEKVRYDGERVEGSHARVTIRIVTTKDTEIPLVYSMKQFSGEWMVYDMAIEGVRLVGNYRTQFRDMLNHMSYREFIAKLKAKVAKLEDWDKGKP